MTNSNKAIKSERLMQYAKDFNADRANLVAANAAVSAGVLEAATDYKGQRSLPRDYSDGNVSVKVVKIIESYARIVNETTWRKG